MNEIVITFNDGSQKSFAKYMSYYDISKSFSMPSDIVGAIVNNRIVSLTDRAERSCKVNFLDMNSIDGNRIYTAGLKMVFESAVKKTFHGMYVKFLYSLPKGIVAELRYDRILNDDEVSEIRKCMSKIIVDDKKFEKLIVKSNDALNYYSEANNYVKAENIKNITDSTVVLYRLDDLINYYYSEMPYSTGVLNKYEIKYLGNNMVVLNYPSYSDGGITPEFVNYQGIIDTYKEAKDWLKIMHVPYINNVNQTICDGKIENFVKSSELKFNLGINEAAKYISANKDIKYVMIAGPSSSGKTTVTKRIANYFEIYGKKPIVISIDDYYKERVDTPKDENGEYDFESVRALDLEYLNKDMKALLDGAEINLPKFNFVTGCKELTGKKVKLTDDSIILLEGLHAINDELLPSLPDNNKYKIFVSPYIPICVDAHNFITAEDLRLLRRIVRDFQTRGYDVERTIKYNAKVREGEVKYINPYIHQADKIINTSLPYEIGILKVYVEPLLFAVKSDSEYYNEARRLLSFLKQFFTISSEYVPKDSILREFIGGNND